MVTSIGIDIIEIDRIEKACKNNRFINRVFSTREIEYIKFRENSYEVIAGGFSAKEAISKVLGTGIRGFSFKDLEILRDDLGKPYVVLNNEAKNIAKNKEIDNIHISISHSKGNAIAFALGEGRGRINKNNNNKYRNFIKSLIPIRSKDGHKGTYGKALIFAGSPGYTGAAYLSALGAVKSGAGTVTLACNKDILDIMSIKLNEAMVREWDFSHDNNIIEKASSIAVGPGLTTKDSTREILEKIIRDASCNIVIDADGLNVLKNNSSILKESKEKIIITPHPKEMSRLTGYEVSYINSNRIKVAEGFAKENNIIVILKGMNSVITDGENTYINPTGNSSMASGGMGDVLTGIICGLLAQGIPPLDATLIGAYVHGYAADLLEKDMYSISATVLAEKIPFVIKHIIE
ncbi:NAD(P)H-hydrate dehydratase [Clostridium hydrogeniformans]|uniref:NAD(P)H-hydrate dehydratase n=1 Tax=Clostridium hydrogeniformans TaxID=349933 RepID=UPI000551B7AA|nr:NAD(P)H-hydrate dehydratase [Clostridium hydrogeniformans]